MSFACSFTFQYGTSFTKLKIILLFFSVIQSCPRLCDSKECSTPGFPVLHHLPELAQTHVHWLGDAIQPSHPLLSPSPTFNLSQHQGLFQSVSSLHQMATVFELQLQHQSFRVHFFCFTTIFLSFICLVFCFLFFFFHYPACNMCAFKILSICMFSKFLQKNSTAVSPYISFSLLLFPGPFWYYTVKISHFCSSLIERIPFISVRVWLIISAEPCSCGLFLCIKMYHILRTCWQDGQIEGHELTSSYKNIEIMTNCSKSSTKKKKKMNKQKPTLEPTKKYTQYPKTKKEP